MAKRTKKEIVTIVTEKPKTLWQKIKDFFYNSHNAFWNWVLGAAGAVTSATIGIVGNVDWSHLTTMLQSGAMFTKEQWILIGGGAFLAGIVGYVTRVWGTKAVDGHLLPKA